MRFTILISFLIVLTIATNELVAQQAIVQGTITEEETGETLIGANIIYGDNQGATSDLDGKYKINLDAGSHKVTFKYIGRAVHVENVTVKAGDILTLDVALVDEMKRLNIVVVSASQYEKDLVAETISMEVVSKDYIKNSNAIELGEAVNKTAGVQIQDGQVTIRGGSSYSYGVGSRTAVLVDGQSFMSEDLGEAQLKFAPIEIAEQIEVIKGASSVMYGSSALNGVVNVRTIWPKNNEHKTEMTAYAGFYENPHREELIWWDEDSLNNQQPHFYGFFLSHQKKYNNFSVVVGGNFTRVKSFLEQNDELRGRINLKTRYQNKKVRGLNYGLNGNLMQEKSERFFISIDLDSNAYRHRAGSDDKYLRANVDPHMKFTSKKGDVLNLQGRYFRVFRFGSGSTIDASTNRYSFDPQYQKNWKDKLIMTTGVPLSYSHNVSNLFDDNGRVTTAMVALYNQLELKVKKLTLQGGIRFEYLRIDTVELPGKPVFRSGLNYRYGKYGSVRASWGQGYRMPTLAERYLAENFTGDVYVIPNPLLVPEYSWQAEMGIIQGFRILDWIGMIDFGTYIQEYDELVEYRFGGYENFWPNGDTIFTELASQVFGMKPFNVENARIFGYEISLRGQGQFGPVKFTTFGGYTYNYPGNIEDDPSQKNMGVFMKRALKYMFKPVDSADLYVSSSTFSILQFRSRHMIRGDIQLDYKKWSLGWSIGYNSFPEVVPGAFKIAIGFFENKLGPNDKSTLHTYVEDHKNGDMQMDMRLSYEPIKNMRLGFICKNITDHDYSKRPGKMEAPRNYTLQVRYQF